MKILNLKKIVGIIFFLVIPSFVFSQESFDDEDYNEDESEISIVEEIKDGFDFSLRFLIYEMIQEPADSSQNPRNLLFKLNEKSTISVFRPDFNFTFRNLELSVKPRFNYEYYVSNGDDSNSVDDETFEDFYINQWLCRYQVFDNLFISTGRENLQWGPSLTSSPSNPFFMNNGKENPQMEVRGMDFSRVVYIPGMEWTISLIACHNEGEAEFLNYGFEKTYGLKIDYNGSDNYGGIIFSHRENDRNRAGFFGGVTANDGLLLYAEGMLSQGTDALYPEKDLANPLGYSMNPVREDDENIYGLFLLGSSYTTESGPTIYFEYIYNSYGYDNEEAENLYILRDTSSEMFLSGGMFQGLGASALIDIYDPGLKFLRQNYFMIQYLHNDINDFLNLTFRVILNIDDSSKQYYLNGEFFVGDHVQIFSSLLLNDGKSDSEYGSVLDYQWSTGLKYTF